MQCDASLLWTLVEQNADPGEEAETIAQHLESCATCRQQLSEIGGDDSWWDEARQCLSTVHDSDLSHTEHELSPLPPVDLSFLESPSHPEMLGRIGRYDVEALLGRGGMGVVLRAYDSDLRRSVAVKVMAPEWAASMQARQRFAREAQAAASVAHENVIPIYNVEADATLPFLVMRYVPGMTLQRWVHANGPPDVATILRVAGQLAEGLAAAHRRGLVHRDIKPGNVLVGENIDRVWITDFGLARAADSMTLTRTGVIAGTPHYMSPEQARGQAVDHRSDLFSLGCVLYFLCSGRPPFDAENTLAVLHMIVTDQAEPLTSQHNDLPPSFVALVHQMLGRSPDKRPHDCEAVIQMLSDAQTEHQQGQVARAKLNTTQRRVLCAASLIAACLLLGVFAWLKPLDGAGDSRNEHSGALVVVDPWASAHESSDAESPYIARVSEQIDSAVAMDEFQFREQVIALNREVSRLEQASDPIVIAPVDSVGRNWQHQVAELERLIRQTQTQYEP